MEKCCEFLGSFRKITWTKTTIGICMMPFVLLLIAYVFVIMCLGDTLGAVVSNSRICAQVGKELLDRGGSAVDAAIGTLLCEGIASPSGSGIGGGFTAIIRQGDHLSSIVATPTLPAAVKEIKHFDESFNMGAKSIGVPGELMGYWEMHEKYGLLSWKEIIEPSIKLCRDGIPITELFAAEMRYTYKKIADSPSMRQLFPYPEDQTYEQNFKMKYPILAKTLRKIADNGVSEFYGGEIGKAFVADVQKEGGILTLEDLKNYKVLWSDKLPKTRLLGKFKVISTPLPTAGVNVMLILNIIKGINPKKNIREFWHYVVEATKLAFELSMTLSDPTNEECSDHLKNTYNKMLDPDYARELRDKILFNETLPSESSYMDIESHYGKGSHNICVLSPNGDIVTVTSTLFSHFGAYFGSTQTGIIANRLLNRFRKTNGRPGGIPMHSAIPNKHFFSPHCPTIILDKFERAYFIVGASGGIKSVSLVANAIIRYVILQQSATEASKSEGQLHNQLFPNVVEFEGSMDSGILLYLPKAGHKVVRKNRNYLNSSSLTCIGNRGGTPQPQFNFQKGGSKVMVAPRHNLSTLIVTILTLFALFLVGVMIYQVLHPQIIAISQYA